MIIIKYGTIYFKIEKIRFYIKCQSYISLSYQKNDVQI